MNRRLAALTARPLVALDVGTATAVAASRDEIFLEPSLVAISCDTGRSVAIGRAAEEMSGRTPTAVTVIRPIRGGRIADPERVRALTLHLLAPLARDRFRKPRVAFAVSDVEAPESLSVLRDAAAAASISDCMFIDAIVAAAWGAGLAAGRAIGNLVVDVGAGKTQAAVVTLDGTAVSHAAAIGGGAVDEALARWLEENEGLRVGERTAERVKRRLAASHGRDDEATIEVSGSDAETGVPAMRFVRLSDLRPALEAPLTEITGVVSRVLAETPPELAVDIVSGAITLTGGGAYLPGLRDVIAARTGRPVICPQDPTLCVALGLLRSLGARGLDDAAAPRQTSRPQVPAGVTTLVSAPPTEAEEETAENAVGPTVAGPQRSESAALLAADRLAARTRVTVNELSKRFRFTRKSNGVRNGPHTASSVSEAVDPEIGELTDLSGRYCSSGRFTEATTCANAALVRAQRLGDAGGKAAALLALASASQAAGGQDRAVGYLHEAVDVAGAAGHLTTEATALAMLARLYYQASEPDKALFYAHAALATETAAPGLEELAGFVHDLEADVAAGRGEPSGSQASGRSHENSDR